MAHKFTLQPLLEIAETLTRTAAVSLGASNRQLQQQQQKLELLLRYRTDYQAQLRRKIAGGLDGANLKNFHDFMEKLEQAIVKQQAAVAEARARTERARDEWQLKERKVKAYGTLSQRHELAAQHHEAQLEQKLQDEFASRTRRNKPHAVRKT